MNNKTIKYVKLFGSTNIGRDFFCFIDTFKIIFSKNKIFPYKFKNVLYKMELREYEMFISQEDLDNINDYTFKHSQLTNKLLSEFKKNEAKFKIFWEHDKIFSSKKYYKKSLALLNLAGGYMLATFPDFYCKVEDYCLNNIKKYVDSSKANEVFQIMTSSTTATTLMNKDRDYIKLLEKKNKNTLHSCDVASFVNTYYFSESSNTDNFNVLSSKTINDRIKRDVKKLIKIKKDYVKNLAGLKNVACKQKALEKKYKFDKRLNNYFYMLRTLGCLRMEIRMRITQPAETTVKLWYDKLEKQLNFKLWITPSELERLLKDSSDNRYKNSLKKLRENRKRGYIWHLNNGQANFIYKKEWNKFLKVHRLEEGDGGSELSGTVSYRGNKEKIQGKVYRIVQGEKNLAVSIDRFPKGGILVANQTTPVFVPALKKARAVITDEGGIMSHAAIVSREFKVPCIVGTKKATQVLKKGDLIEVNTIEGVVRMI